MSELVIGIVAWACGGALGVIFFVGLWWTVRKGTSSPWAPLWFSGSLLLRMSLTLAGFYFVSAGHWERLILSLLGFIMARLAVTRLTRPTQINPTRPAEEANHAP